MPRIKTAIRRSKEKVFRQKTARNLDNKDIFTSTSTTEDSLKPLEKSVIKSEQKKDKITHAHAIILLMRETAEEVIRQFQLKFAADLLEIAKLFQNYQSIESNKKRAELNQIAQKILFKAPRMHLKPQKGRFKDIVKLNRFRKFILKKLHE